MFLFSDTSILAMTTWLLPLAIIVLLYLSVWTFREPFNGTMLIFLTIPVLMPIIGEADGSSFYTIRLYSIFTIITFCSLTAAILRRKYHGFASTVLTIPFGLYCLANVLSLFNTPYLDSSIRQFMKLLGVNVAMYIVIVTTLNSRKRLENAIKILFSVGIIIALIGIVQNILYFFLHIDLFLNIKNAPRAATAAFAEKGWFPQYATLLFSIALPLYFSNSFTRWKPKLLVCMCIFGVVIASGLNRASYVVTILIVIAASMLKIGGQRLRSLAKATILLLAALFIASLIPSFFEEGWKLVQIRSQKEMFSLDEPSNARRVDLAEETLKHIKAHPFIGQGFGSWGKVVPPQTVKGGGSEGGSAFNIVLGILYDGGILGLIAFGLICYLYLKCCFDLLKTTKDPYHKTMLYVAILAFLNIMFTAQFHPSWLTGYAWMAIAMGMAICNIVKGEMGNESRLCTAQLKSRRR